MIKDITPLYDRLVVKKDRGEKKTDSGIVLPSSDKEELITGQVLAVGKGRLLKDGHVAPLQIEEEDLVVFGKHAGLEIDQDHVILKEDEVLGLLNQKEI